MAPAVGSKPVVDDPKAFPAARLEPQLPVFCFCLRHMFWGVTVVCMVLAAVVSGAGAGFAPLATLLFVSVVALHVAGTAIGTRLRQHADELQAWKAGKQAVPSNAPLPITRPSSFYRHGGVPMPWIPGWVVAGLVLGAAAGVLFLVATIGHRTTVIGVAVGAISTAILGGWFAFVAASFWAVLRQGWQEAADDQRQHPSR